MGVKSVCEGWVKESLRRNGKDICVIWTYLHSKSTSSLIVCSLVICAIVSVTESGTKGTALTNVWMSCFDRTTPPFSSDSQSFFQTYA